MGKVPPSDDRFTFAALWDFCDAERQFWQACADNAEAHGDRPESAAKHRRRMLQMEKLCNLLTLIGSDNSLKARLYRLADRQVAAEAPVTGEENASEAPVGITSANPDRT
jgi:hypothetical protein